ncbi:chemotaxis protein CheC [Photobacterium jeanii]|uniref:Chemotaxis protein CheC n=2 Tax=Photobacterium jeanii TaxID=858640 RepID=A0A178KPD5_9GAMM|nr:chemotaxis protein CheC [Photobacterium jeanii]PST92810.1 response regulator [Photobacterium jeanii]
MTRYLNNMDNVVLHYALNGKEGLECLRQHPIDVLFLDLTMPVMDGYTLLEKIATHQIDTRVVVLSADVQKEASNRCRDLGASHFIGKPFEPEELFELLQTFGINSPKCSDLRLPSAETNYLEVFREVANVALGRGAAIISDHLGEFIRMPLPVVTTTDASTLAVSLSEIRDNNGLAISQRFVGGGIYGEALVRLHGKDIALFGERLGFSQVDEQKNEIVTDIANLMVSSFLVALTEHMNIPFSVRQPIVVEEYMGWGDTTTQANHTFSSVGYAYRAESLDFECDVLFLMDNSSTTVIKKIMETLH